MATRIIMPQGGQDITEGVVVRWLRKEGDPIRKGEVICEVETEKAVFEVESPSDGVLLKIIAAEGTRVPVYAVIGVVGEPGESLGTEVPQAAEPAGGTAVDVAAIRRRLAAGSAGGPAAKVSGRARRLAADKGVDLAGLAGSGPRGRVTEKDVLLHVEKRRLAVPALKGKAVPLSRMRLAVARRMRESKQSIPHFYVTATADVTEALEMRARLRREQGHSASITDIVLKASALALREVPAVNCRLQGDQAVYLDDVNIGIAVTLDDGVLVPVIACADRLPLAELCRRSAEIIALARQGRVSALEPACFTVSNLGMLGVDGFTAIINPPETGILAVGRVRRQPAVHNEAELRIRDVLTLTLSVDHRVVDGALAARFLARVRHHLETPLGLLE
jgi:pyruvate dehydrogenase E2 component (dihydrolipoamide acetyltransferase)